MRKPLATLLSLLLLAGLFPTARAAKAYPDLPESHWAYPVMTQAVTRGILTGYEDGAMHPSDSLTWGQCLVMLGRAFYAPTLEKYPFVEGTHWATPAYQAALEKHVLEQADFLPASPMGADAPISRRDTAVLVDRVLLRVYGVEPVAIGTARLTDFAALPEPYRAPILQCSARGIIKGYEDGRFGGTDLLDRAAGAALMVRALVLVEDDIAGEVVPPPANPAAPPGTLTSLGSNSAKLVRLYGTDTMTRYPTKEEAAAQMVSVTVPVWRLDKTSGTKTPGKLTFPVHAAIAGDMTAIFTEIYNDPEQFPIYSIGGYDWRGSSAKGEHNCGTAVDINYIENYQIYANGSIGAGECWLPGENPWSIPENGSVVRIFTAHGYSWGGNAWPTNKDYMHFSYLGV